MVACPVNTNAGGYVQEIGRDNLEAAYELASAPNPLASVCGRVCAHPCEQACRRGKMDGPISIRALKRVATEAYGVERPFPDSRDQWPRQAVTLGQIPLPEQLGRKSRVAVIGAGPAGLACAHDLAVMGYCVTIFEAADIAGGLLVLGIPEYRLPRDIIRAEVKRILDMGVKLQTGQKLGVHFRLKALFKEGFEVVFLAIGAGHPREFKIPGSGLDGVMNGIDFLLNVNLGYKVKIGEKVVVLGGGDVAMDSARTALRLGSEEREEEEQWEQYLAMDTARAASRLGSRDINVVYRRSRAEMPAREAEIREAEEEGVKFQLLTNPIRIESDEHGKVKGMQCVKMKLGDPDESGRRSPMPIEGSEFFMECDTVLIAVGQRADEEMLSHENGMELSDQGLIKVDKETLATSVPGVYAGGDVAFGPRIVISAIADGKRAALSIHEYLMGKKGKSKKVTFSHAEMKRQLREYDRVGRSEPPTLPTGRRTGFTEVERVYEPDDAVTQADRCLWCHISPVFDSSKCILCGGCTDICPERCLAIVPFDRLQSDQPIEKIAAAFNVNEQSAAMIKDENLCIRCGLCARRCPTGAITMERMNYEVA